MGKIGGLCFSCHCIRWNSSAEVSRVGGGKNVRFGPKVSISAQEQLDFKLMPGITWDKREADF